MTEPAIQVQGLWKKFRKGELYDSLRELIPALMKKAVRGSFTGDLGNKEFWALADVTFEVARGQSLGIIGPNGAGKSTLLKVLSRIMAPNRGSYHIHGRLSSLIEIGAGFHGDLTGRENIYLNGAILGMKRREIRAKEEAIIEFSGVREFIDTPVKRYSSGMKARLGFAVAAHMDPDILLIDEVLSVGDALFRDKCLRHMHKLLNSGITVIFISHILDQVRNLCPNTVVLDKGRVVYNGPTDPAIRLYLDLLSRQADAATETVDAPVSLRNIRFLTPEGDETLEWNVEQPGLVEFEFQVHRPVGDPFVLINFSSISGIYLGTANSSHQDLKLPNRPGTCTVRFTLDPIPFGEGDYSLEFKIHDAADELRCLWGGAQALAITLRGPRRPGPMVRCDGNWTIQDQPASTRP